MKGLARSKKTSARKLTNTRFARCWIPSRGGTQAAIYNHQRPVTYDAEFDARNVPAPARSCGFPPSTKWYSAIMRVIPSRPVGSRPSSHRFLLKYETFVARLRTYRCIALTDNKRKSNEWLEGHRVVRAHRVIFQQPATSTRHEIWQAKARRGRTAMTHVLVASTIGLMKHVPGKTWTK